MLKRQKFIVSDGKDQGLAHCHQKQTTEGEETAELQWILNIKDIDMEKREDGKETGWAVKSLWVFYTWVVG